MSVSDTIKCLCLSYLSRLWDNPLWDLGLHIKTMEVNGFSDLSFHMDFSSVGNWIIWIIHTPSVLGIDFVCIASFKMFFQYCQQCDFYSNHLVLVWRKKCQKTNKTRTISMNKYHQVLQIKQQNILSVHFLQTLIFFLVWVLWCGTAMVKVLLALGRDQSLG